jgi:DNA-binding XRE family transcriptional regulator
MTNVSVYVPLVLNSENARKIYSLSRLEGISIGSVAEKIIDEYLEDREVPDVLNSSRFNYRKAVKSTELREKIGRNIAYLRCINFLSQRRLGEIIDLDQQKISSIEAGKRKLDIIEAMAIAEALGVKLEEIFA